MLQSCALPQCSFCVSLNYLEWRRRDTATKIWSWDCGMESCPNTHVVSYFRYILSLVSEANLGLVPHKYSLSLWGCAVGMDAAFPHIKTRKTFLRFRGCPRLLTRMAEGTQLLIPEITACCVFSAVGFTQTLSSEQQKFTHWILP